MAKKSKRGKGAVAKVWQIVSKMPRATRKEVVAACTKVGINPRTADTQFYKFRHASPSERKAKIA